MRTKKLSFSEITGVMSRSEMKKIMAGSGGLQGSCNYSFVQGMVAHCDRGQTPAGCLSRGSGQYEAYCYVDSSGTCYGMGDASCSAA